MCGVYTLSSFRRWFYSQPFQKNSAPSGFYKQWLIHLQFLQWGKALCSQDWANKLTSAWWYSWSSFSVLFGNFSLCNYFANAYIWTISIWKLFFSLFCTNTKNLSTVLVLTRLSSQTRKLISITGAYPPPMLSLPLRVTSVMSLMLQ